MKNKILLLSISVYILISCSDWTEIESIDIKEPPTTEELNPELYIKYLENLREYKSKSEHKITYVHFDNTLASKNNRSQHLSDLPDSINIISLASGNIESYMVNEMKDVQKKKGTKVVYSINYEDLLTEYRENESVDEKTEDEEQETDNFIAYMESYLNKELAWSDEFQFDGISVWYEPKDLTHMEETEQIIENNRQDIFINRLKEWISDNPNKMFIFESNSPHILKDKSILADSKYLVIHTENVDKAEKLTQAVKQTLVEGVPSDRFIVFVSTYSLNPVEVTTGYFRNNMGESVSAILEGAYWVMTPEDGIEKAGLGIYNVQNDYFNKSFIYPYTRKAISQMNPSPKK